MHRPERFNLAAKHEGTLLADRHDFEYAIGFLEALRQIRFGSGDDFWCWRLWFETPACANECLAAAFWRNTVWFLAHDATGCLGGCPLRINQLNLSVHKRNLAMGKKVSQRLGKEGIEQLTRRYLLGCHDGTQICTSMSSSATAEAPNG